MEGELRDEARVVVDGLQERGQRLLDLDGVDRVRRPRHVADAVLRTVVLEPVVEAAAVGPAGGEAARAVLGPAVVAELARRVPGGRAHAVRRRRRRDLERRVHAVEAVDQGARRVGRVGVEAAEVPLAREEAPVARGFRGVGDRERARLREGEARVALRRVAAVVDVVHAVPEVVPARQDRRARRRADRAAAVGVLEGDGPRRRGPGVDVARERGAAVVGHVAPADVVAEEDEHRRLAGRGDDREEAQGEAHGGAATLIGAPASEARSCPCFRILRFAVKRQFLCLQPAVSSSTAAVVARAVRGFEDGAATRAVS